MKYLVLPFILVLIAFHSNSQKLKPPTQVYEWGTCKLSSNSGDYFDNSPSFSQYILDAGETDKIVPVKMKKSYGLVRLNAEGRQIWNADLEGQILGVSISGNNVFAFTSLEERYIKDVVLTSFDIKSGKKTGQLNVYHNNSGNSIEVIVLNNNKGELRQVFVRTRDKSGSSVKFEMVQVSPGLEVKTIPVKPSYLVDEFLGVYSNNVGDLLMAGVTPAGMTGFRFNAAGEEKSKVTVPFTSTGKNFLPKLCLDPTEQGIVLGIDYHPAKKTEVFQVFHFDLNAGKATVSTPVELNKDFAKGLDMQKIKGARSGNMKSIDGLEPCGIFCFGDKIGMIQQIRLFGETTGFSGNQFSHTYFVETDGWIISIYDKDLKLLKNFGLEKEFKSYSPFGLSLGYHLYGDKLYVLSPALTGIASYGTTFCQVDLSSMQITQASLLDQSGFAPDKVAEPDATKWFNNEFLIEYQIPEGLMQNYAHSVHRASGL